MISAQANGGDLEKQRDLAFTVDVHQKDGDYKLILVAGSAVVKGMWVSGLTKALAQMGEVRAAHEQARLLRTKQRLDRFQVRVMIRQQLQLEGRDPNVSDAWIDGIFEQFAAPGCGTVDGEEWNNLAAVLKQKQPLNRGQVRKMVANCNTNANFVWNFLLKIRR